MKPKVTIDLEEAMSVMTDSDRENFFIEEFNFFEDRQPRIMVKLFEEMCEADKEEAIIGMLDAMENSHSAIIRHIKGLPTECWEYYTHMEEYLKDKDL